MGKCQTFRHFCHFEMKNATFFVFLERNEKPNTEKYPKKRKYSFIAKYLKENEAKILRKIYFHFSPSKYVPSEQQFVRCYGLNLFHREPIIQQIKAEYKTCFYYKIWLVWQIERNGLYNMEYQLDVCCFVVGATFMREFYAIIHNIVTRC